MAAGNPVGEEELRRALIAATVAKTGYPEEMLELDLDLEADLGIDTVKQVDIFATVRARFSIERDPNVALRELNTLRKAIAHFQERLAASAPQGQGTGTPASLPVPVASAPAAFVAPAAVVALPAPSAAPNDRGASESAFAPPAPIVGAPTAGPAAFDRVHAVLLRHVVEKTGYPEEMLGLDLDLEADLGIDTVKQVDILARTREVFSIPREPNFTLRDVNTLRKVVVHLVERLPSQPVAPVAVPPPAASLASTLLAAVLQAPGDSPNGTSNGTPNGLQATGRCGERGRGRARHAAGHELRRAGDRSRSRPPPGGGAGGPTRPSRPPGRPAAQPLGAARPGHRARGRTLMSRVEAEEVAVSTLIDALGTHAATAWPDRVLIEAEHVLLQARPCPVGAPIARRACGGAPCVGHAARQLRGRSHALGAPALRSGASCRAVLVGPPAGEGHRRRKRQAALCAGARAAGGCGRVPPGGAQRPVAGGRRAGCSNSRIATRPRRATSPGHVRPRPRRSRGCSRPHDGSGMPSRARVRGSRRSSASPGTACPVQGARSASRRCSAGRVPRSRSSMSWPSSPPGGR